ncbi:restriction endonuclease subunit S [Salicibibacter halophilus]|uniref:Restriction endonuclease subunit S n=1 Tax=Salicibibacter halophilus TaxID=2502791 RepID=A0A514LFZ2_9BACI|nr:restriction endonuclease subunit S [Salicibibacter halophilus]QDI90770.1 restriction endonuclease subunit S [Salicibibacter halophilus]
MNGWEIKNIENIGEVITGSTPKTANSDFWNGTVQFVTPTDITRNRKIMETEKKVTELGVEQGKEIPPNSILVTCIASIGKIAISSERCITNQQINSVIPNEYNDPNYIFYSLLYRRNQLEALAGATTVPIINKKTFSQFKILAAPLPEQHKIAAILTSVDDAIEKMEAIIAQTEKVKKGLMQKFLTQGIGHTKFKQTEIGEIPEEWEVISLGDLSTAKPAYGAGASASSYNTSLPRYIRITDVDQFGRLNNDDPKSIDNESANGYVLSQGDLLFARSGATVGKTYLYNKEDGYCAYAGYLIRFKLDINRVLPEFIFNVTHSNYYYRWVTRMLRAGAQPNINAKEYSSLLVPVPPIKEQTEIVDIITSVDNKITAEHQKLAQLQALKKGLMQVLLTGKVRVKVDEDEVVST